ncbi:MAG TPA: hypothetical protein VFN97_21520, partial [Actinospica sp.]|nr:hypothetical protein [Actinospica sp.]
MDEAEFVWIRMSLVAAPDHRLHCSYTVISQAPLSREQQTELYDVVYAIARSTAEAMPQEADDDEAPLPFTATILEPQAGAVFSGAANAMLTAALPAASVFGTLADGTETIESEARTAAIGALGLLISNSGPDAEPAELLCQAMVFPTIELPWDETLNRISSGLRIAGVIFALATGNPAMPASCAGGLAHTAVTKIMGALVRSILRSMFGPSEEVIDLTRPALSAESQRQEPPTPAALPDRTVIEIPETPTPAKPPA